jgi:glycosyltransferase involved in cell wall biosynthesis
VTASVDDAERPPVVSVVIPCLIERAAIGGAVLKASSGLMALQMPGEVIVVDNGSTDGSAAAAAAAGARVVHESRRGYGSACQRGFAESRGQYVVMGDGDGTYPLERLNEFVALLEAGFDLVNGDRFTGGIDPGAMTWSHRYLGTPMLSWLLRSVSGAKLADSQCGMRAFRSEALAGLKLRAQGMEFASEMLVKSARAGLRITEVPVHLSPRVGESKLQTTVGVIFATCCSPVRTTSSLCLARYFCCSAFSLSA